jgi:type IV fimbrial biogenesis protein FimT
MRNASVRIDGALGALVGLRRVRALRGFTLIELLVTIAIVGVLLALAAPSFSDASLASKLAASANRLSASAILARSEAIKRNIPVILCASADGSTCAASGGWEQGWIVKTATTVLLAEQAAPGGFKITEASVTPLITLSFQPTGVGTTQATFKVCRATPSVGTQERTVAINATGRTFVKKETSGTCA